MFSFFNKREDKSNKQNLVDTIKNGALLLDVRTPIEFAAGHVLNSINIPLDRLDVELDRLKNATEIVVFCLSGGRSARAKSFLNNKGFLNVHDGQTWQKVKAIVEM